jgi:exonuclease I
MTWKQNLKRKVSAYMERDIKVLYLGLFLSWWEKFSPEILNEFEFVVDDERDKAAMKELFDLKGIILRDANINNDDANVQRVLFHFTQFIKELDQEVEYEEDPEWEDHQRRSKTSA